MSLQHWHTGWKICWSSGCLLDYTCDDDAFVIVANGMASWGTVVISRLKSQMLEFAILSMEINRMSWWQNEQVFGFCILFLRIIVPCTVAEGADQGLQVTLNTEFYEYSGIAGQADRGIKVGSLKAKNPSLYYFLYRSMFMRRRTWPVFKTMASMYLELLMHLQVSVTLR